MIEEKKNLKELSTKKEHGKINFQESFTYGEEIAENINGYTGKKRKYWERVMDLYKEKYS